MRVAVVDWRQNRRGVLAALIEGLVDPLAKRLVHVHCLEGQECATTGLSYERVEEKIRGLVSEIDIILLHVGDEQVLWREVLEGAYRDKYCVCYSGSPIEAGLTRDNLKHCSFLRPVPIELEPSEIKENLRAYFDALGENPETASDMLNGFDPDLEAKLGLLYACLGGSTSLTNFENSKDDWRRVKSIVMADGAKVEDLVEAFKTELPLNDGQQAKLRILRDGLLPD